MATNSSYGQLVEFQPDSESFTAYSECVVLFLTANDIAEDKQVPVLLSAIGTKLYSLLRDLMAPDKPATKSVDEILAVLKAHFEQERVVIAE
jgi:hypothetical protein